jgi:hypothetical protein
VLVAHTYNPNSSGGRDQEDHSSKPAWANCSRDPISKNLHKKELVEWLKGVSPEFKPQCHQKRIGFNVFPFLCWSEIIKILMSLHGENLRYFWKENPLEHFPDSVRWNVHVTSKTPRKASATTLTFVLLCLNYLTSKTIHLPHSQVEPSGDKY